MSDDPLMELDQHLTTLHEADTATAYRCYRTWVVIATVMMAVTLGTFLASLVVARWFALGLPLKALLTMWTISRVATAREVWRVHFEWADDAT